MAEKLDPEAKRLCNISPGELADAIGALEAGPSASDAEIHKLYRCHDRLLVHKQAVFDHLTGRWRDLFNILNDSGAVSNSVAGADIVDLQPHKVAASEFAIDGARPPRRSEPSPAPAPPRRRPVRSTA